jgi:hypothetical protein
MRSFVLAVTVVVLVGCSREAQSASSRATNHQRTVLLELFTSQGCSSCPPADQLLSKLRKENFDGAVVIPLAYHVDYWNHLGWRDPFSSAQWSARQRAYAASIPGSQVYTPQLIVNGTVQLVGSSERHIRAEIERQLAGRDGGSVTIDRVTRAGNQLKVQVHASSTSTLADLMVVLFENGVETAVSRGENANRNLANDAIVRWESKAAEVPAEGTNVTETVTIPLDAGWRADSIGVAAFLQDSKSRAILASAVR